MSDPVVSHREPSDSLTVARLSNVPAALLKTALLAGLETATPEVQAQILKLLQTKITANAPDPRAESLSNGLKRLNHSYRLDSVLMMADMPHLDRPSKNLTSGERIEIFVTWAAADSTRMDAALAALASENGLQ